MVDNDKFSTNQFLHPLQGSVYQSLARSAGLSFWQASAYTFGGSLLWEEAGENTAPSFNDQVASGIGGNFLGEPLFRIASLLLESGSGSTPGFWRELGATRSPPAPDSIAWSMASASHRCSGATTPRCSPAWTWRVPSEAATTVASTSTPTRARRLRSRTTSAQTGSATFTMAYGLPGKPDYNYDRPFDYFNFEFTADNVNSIESVFSRGLLVGSSYEAGDSYRGVWGLYGIYDYVAPNIFRVSNTAGAVGTTGQWWLSHSIALQGTALAGVGYAGGGVIRGAGVRASGINGEGLRNYHYGVTPESVLALRVILGDRAALDTTARGYYISKLGASESTGSETLDTVDVALTFRVFDLHAITIRYSLSSRDGRYVNQPDSHQTVRTTTIAYTLLGHERFGAVDWRNGS